MSDFAPAYFLMGNIVNSAKEYIKDATEREYFYMSIIRAAVVQGLDVWTPLSLDSAYRSAMRRVHPGPEYDEHFE